MQEGIKEALRLWLRTARIPSVVALLELLKAELQRRGVVLEFSVDDRAPEGGPRR